MVCLLGNSLSVPQRVKYRVTVWGSNSTPSYMSRRNENLCLHKHLNVHSINHGSQEVETIQMSHRVMNGEANWWFRIMQYYSSLQRKEALCVATWMDFENLCKWKTDTEADVLWFHLYGMSKRGKSDRDRLVAAECERGGEWGMIAHGFRFSFGGDKNHEGITWWWLATQICNPWKPTLTFEWVNF